MNARASAGSAAADRESSGAGAWLLELIRQELGPYPGRWNLVARMVIAATLTTIVVMTFRIPSAAMAGYYSLLLSRDSPQTTMRSALVILGAYLLCAAFCIVGVLLFIGYPLTHFLFVIAGLFLSFFIIRAASNYTAAAAFAFTIVIVIPLWDLTRPTDLLLTGTLWAASSVSVGLAVTVAVEYLFGLFDPRDPLVEGIVDRLAVVSEVLSTCCGAGPGTSTRMRLERYGTVGVSRLRRLASRQQSQPSEVVVRTTVVSLVGRLVDLSSAVLHLPEPLNQNDAERLRRAGHRIEAITKLWRHNRRLAHFEPSESSDTSTYPLLPEIERTIGLLAVALTEIEAVPSNTREETEESPGFWLPDAFTNPEYRTFALYGTLAASLCYVLMNAVAWHGLNTSLATCVVTALSTVGSSRQKQMLRLSGALAGGLLFGIGSQVLILPMLDSIGGFVVLFAGVTFMAAWVATASARVSYFGLQMALAFNLVHLQEFGPQTNLAVGRDRVMGVLLGLLAMWFVFDRLAGKPAADVMRRTFGDNLRLLALLAEPWPAGQEHLSVPQIAALRERIHSNFATVNAQADAVLLEVGPERRTHMQMRNRARAWQPSLRALFVVEVALLQIRLQTDPAQLAPAIVHAQRVFDANMRRALEDLAVAFEQHSQPASIAPLEESAAQLQHAIRGSYPSLPPRSRAILSLSSQIVKTVAFLQSELRLAAVRLAANPGI